MIEAKPGPVFTSSPQSGFPGKCKLAQVWRLGQAVATVEPTEDPVFASMLAIAFAEAGNVYEETGLSPRQLAERLKQTEEAHLRTAEALGCQATAFEPADRAKLLAEQRAELLEALADLLSVEDAKRQIWSADMSESKRDRMLTSNDAHRAKAEAKARAAITKATGGAA